MKLADSHLHFFAAGYRSAYGVLFPEGRELAVYQAFRRIHRIDTALVVGYEGLSYHGNNNEIAKLAALHDWIHPLAYCVPGQPPAPARMIARMQQRFAGISLYVPTVAAAKQLVRWPEKLIALLNHRRALVSINVPLGHLPALRPFLERLSEARALISHLGLPWIPRRRAAALRPLTALARLPHVGVKASAFYACGDPFPHAVTQPVFATVLDAFGPRRLYWGSDFSPALEFVSFVQTIDVLDSFRLDDGDRRCVLGGNLRALLKRPVRADA